MKVKLFKSNPDQGVLIELTQNEMWLAIHAYILSRDVHISGPSTTRINGEYIEGCSVYVDPSGFVIKKGKKIGGKN